MALKDILALVDDKLADIFKTVAYTPDRDREKFAARIDATKTKFLATEPARGKKDYSVANNVVEYRPSLGGAPVKIGGKDVIYIPAERFVHFLDGLKAVVAAGELDKELEAASKDAPASTRGLERGDTPPRAKRTKTEGGGTGWSPERKAKYAATIAARNAAKNQ